MMQHFRFDTTQRQLAKAEIEDALGVTHHVEVLVNWDSDYLVGKEVSVTTTRRRNDISRS